MPRAFSSLFFLIGVSAIIASAASSVPTVAAASSFRVIYGFCSVSQCADGESPNGDLVQDSAGNLYGITTNSPKGGGIVFELTPSGGNWTEQVLYDFCYDGSCAGGNDPIGGLILDTAGNLYGANAFIADKLSGTVFELSPNAQRTAWSVKVLHKFCAKVACADGAVPSKLSYQGAAEGSPYDGVSPLYGTTMDGGKNGFGTAFQLTSSGQGSQWTYKILHDFCARACTDGQAPASSLVVDPAGNLYGTTYNTLFELKPGKSRWKIATLHSFCSAGDGCNPQGSLLMDASGTLYGVTENGGNQDGDGETAGVVYNLTTGSAPQYSVLYSFCPKENCLGGRLPRGGLAMTSTGILFGTTFADGGSVSGENGVMFDLSPREKVLHAFCLTDCKDGSQPQGGLLKGANNHIFGTTWQGGPHSGGEVFEYVP